MGAELSANHQNEQAMRQSFLARRADQALKEALAVACGTRIARDFLAGNPPPTAEQIARLLEVPPPLVEDVLDALVRAGLAARSLAGREIGHLPARDPGAVRANDLREALRRDPHAERIRARVERRIDAEIARVLAALEEEVRRSPSNLTVRELALRTASRGGEPASVRTPRAAPAEGDGADAVDAKQPDVPR